MTYYRYTSLIKLAIDIMIKAGYPENRAQITAETLVEADLMGHFTHGLNLFNPYLEDVVKGGMKLDGDPKVINDNGANITWSGEYQSGPWLVRKAMDIAFERIKEHSVITVAIGQCHHIGCLAAYLEYATDKNLMMLLASSDPKNSTVAPYGGRTGAYSPNPLAVGIPTEGEPIIIDISMSSTANGLVGLKKASGEKLPQKWLLGTDGKPTDDPNTFFETPPSTILPLGGLETGYKGFGLGLIIDMLTSGLAGYGRADNPTNWGASVYFQVFDPEGFGGADNFKKQAQHLVNTCLSSEPFDHENHVRIPGSRALKLRDQRKKEGLPLSEAIVNSLKKWSNKFGIDMSDYDLKV
ncbi:MAG: Ldh family oxidoreductase [Maribacter sp.]